MADIPKQSRSTKAKVPKLKTFLVLHGILFLYSMGAVCSKMASNQPFLSLEYLAWYGGLLVILILYAAVWQQVLRQLPLITAFANKGITILWGVLWGVLLFGESVSLTMIIGIALVFCGILLVVSDHGK